MNTLDEVFMKSEICIIEGCDRIKDKKQNRRICQMHRIRYSRYKSYDLPQKQKLPEGISKICSIHGSLKEDQVYKTTTYIWPQCLQCKKISNDKFKKENPLRNTNELRSHYYIRNSKLKLSKNDYNIILEHQNFVCAICLKPEIIINGRKNRIPKRLAIDHCHKTNKIRGLLCHKCNVSIGAMYESIELLQSAITYLKKHI
jgi:hypothetical protein